MKTNRVAVAALIAVVAAPAAFAQEAVQWRVEDGGNGHWYQIQSTIMDWSVARDSAASRGGHLASITSADENTFVFTLITSSGTPNDYWLGGYRTDATCSPPCLEWITGEPWTFEVWTQGDSWGCWNPNPNACGWNGQGTGLALEFNARPDTGDAGRWNDESPNLYYNGNIIGCPSVVEWSADCNGDGIVDYGQILLGELVDANANGVPDLCECDADINDDGVVNGADISVLLGYWGQSGKNVVGDLTGDGIVNGADLSVLLGSWGPCK